MNFATLPPEINSGRMHRGPGPGSMTEAATAWEQLATRLYTAAADYRAVTSRVAAACAGPASAAITVADVITHGTTCATRSAWKCSAISRGLTYHFASG